LPGEAALKAVSMKHLLIQQDWEISLFMHERKKE